MVGPSVGYFVRPPRTQLSEGNYAEVLEDLLNGGGTPATVTNSAGWFLLVHEAYQQIEDLVLRHSPDVVITNFGMGECQPKLIPTTTLRWLYTWRPKSHLPSRALRRLLLKRVNKAYTAWSPKLISALPWTPYRLSPKRFEHELERLVGVVRKERKALVLMVNASPAGPKLEAILPGTDGRAQEFNAITDRVADRAGDDVEVIDARTIVQEAGPERAVPDGIHFSAAGHRLIAEALHRRIESWVARGAGGLGTSARSENSADKSGAVGSPRDKAGI
ncbi:MAG: hypothetical protein QOG03_1842 [Actinomycetota bacterium]|nr:hypothetical protein [Actinomycetota bacterium]